MTVRRRRAEAVVGEERCRVRPGALQLAPVQRAADARRGGSRLRGLGDDVGARLEGAGDGRRCAVGRDRDRAAEQRGREPGELLAGDGYRALTGQEETSEGTSCPYQYPVILSVILHFISRFLIKNDPVG